MPRDSLPRKYLLPLHSCPAWRKYSGRSARRREEGAAFVEYIFKEMLKFAIKILIEFSRCPYCYDFSGYFLTGQHQADTRCHHAPNISDYFSLGFSLPSHRRLSRGLRLPPLIRSLEFTLPRPQVPTLDLRVAARLIDFKLQAATGLADAIFMPDCRACSCRHAFSRRRMLLAIFRAVENSARDIFCRSPLGAADYTMLGRR